MNVRQTHADPVSPMKVSWPEVESRVHYPAVWIVALIGGVFLAVGVILLAISSGKIGDEHWIAVGMGAGFALMGGLMFLCGLHFLVIPRYVRHAALDTLPSLPTEPVLQELSAVQAIKHELVDCGDNWQLRPASKQLKLAALALWGFWVLLMVMSIGLLSWAWQREFPDAHWILVTIAAATVSGICGGGAAFMGWSMVKLGYRILISMTIPKNGGSVEWDCPAEPGKYADGLTWLFQGGTKRARTSVDRNSIVGMQLVPWKYEHGGRYERSTTWAVQGLLVLKANEAVDFSDSEFRRLPLLIAPESQTVAAARLMRQLAEVLHVPFLFHATREGWREELLRAKTRPRMQSGGHL